MGVSGEAEGEMTTRGEGKGREEEGISSLPTSPQL